MHDIYKQKCLVKSIYLVLQIKHCKKVRSSIGFNPRVYESFGMGLFNTT